MGALRRAAGVVLMKGEEMRAIRVEALELTELQLARLIGYTGTDRNDDMRIREYERGKKQIPLYIARLVWMLHAWADLTGQLPNFPEWPDYDFEHTPDDEVRG